MTDEEIEKAIAICTNERGEFRERPCELCPYEKYSRNQQCGRRLKMNALNYINRLKAENEKLKDTLNAVENDEINLRGNLEECVDKLEHIRKDTAKEIFHDIYQTLAINYVDEEIGFQDECIDTACLYEDLKEIAAKHGIEVDDE